MKTYKFPNKPLINGKYTFVERTLSQQFLVDWADWGLRAAINNFIDIGLHPDTKFSNIPDECLK